MGTLTVELTCGMLEPKNRLTGPSQALSVAESPVPHESRNIVQPTGGGELSLCSVFWFCFTLRLCLPAGKKGVSPRVVEHLPSGTEGRGCESFPEETGTENLDRLLFNHKQGKISRGGGWMGRDQLSLTGASGRASLVGAEKVAGSKRQNQ